MKESRCALMKMIDGGVTAPQGFLAAGAAAGIRKKGRPDVAVVYSQVKATAAAVYTQNKFKAAPLMVTEQHLTDGQAQAFVINSGIANAGMGQKGLVQAQEMAQQAADALGIAVQEVIIASTGVIGMPLPMDKLKDGIQKAAQSLKASGGGEAAYAIMTTDTVQKEAALQVDLGGQIVTMGAMAKGSGMIHPNMATMLGFITTDAAVEAGALKAALKLAVDESFNMISVDGDTSTNDMVAVLANGQAGNAPLNEASPHWPTFVEALKLLCQHLAKAIIASSLVKAAIYGQDANWGRIACALGYSGAEFDAGQVSIALGDVQVAQDGMGLDFDEEKAAEVLAQKQVTITTDLGAGPYAATAWGRCV